MGVKITKLKEVDNCVKKDLLISRGRRPRTGKVFACPVCGKNFYLKPYQANKNSKHYCSYPCRYKGQETKVELICKNCKNPYKTYISHIKWRGSSFCSRKCSGEWRSKNEIGENNRAWKGGKSKIYRRIRGSKMFKEWRITVFKRDSYTCQECGVKSGIGKKVELHPHHILSFTHYPKERFNTSNGKTLCSKCHIKHHKIHGYGKTKINQNT